MKRSTILFLALAATVNVAALSSACSSDNSTAAGPKNQPPTNNPTTDSGTTTPGNDASTGTDGGQQTCNGPTFDNTRVPGWPNVPQP